MYTCMYMYSCIHVQHTSIFLYRSILCEYVDMCVCVCVCVYVCVCGRGETHSLYYIVAIVHRDYSIEINKKYIKEKL